MLSNWAQQQIAQYRQGIENQNREIADTMHANAERVSRNRRAALDAEGDIIRQRIAANAQLAVEKERTRQAEIAAQVKRDLLRDQMIADGKMKRVRKNYGRGGGWVTEWHPK